MERAAPRSMLIKPVADWGSGRRWRSGRRDRMWCPACSPFQVGTASACASSQRLAPPQRVSAVHRAVTTARRNCNRRSAIRGEPSAVAFGQAWGNDPLAIRRLLRAAPSSLELDIGVADAVVVAHDSTTATLRTAVRAGDRAGGRNAARRRREVLSADDAVGCRVRRALRPRLRASRCARSPGRCSPRSPGCAVRWNDISVRRPAASSPSRAPSGRGRTS